MNVPLKVRLTLPDGTRLLGGEDLKLVAQYGDACNVNGDLATLRHKFDVIRQHCETVGRDYNSIHRTTRTTCVIGDTDEQAQAKIPDMMRARVALNEALIGSPDTIQAYCGI